MPSHPLLNKKLLAVAVSFAVMAEYSQAATINVTGDYINDGEVVVTTPGGVAVSYNPVDYDPSQDPTKEELEQGKRNPTTFDFTNNGTIEGDTHAIAIQAGKKINLLTNTGTISSKNGAAIVAVGDGRIKELVNQGTITGGMVNGEQIAIDMRSAEERDFMVLKMMGGSTINGNIHLNGKSDYSYRVSSDINVFQGEGAATFNGTAITGVNRIVLMGNSHLKLAAQDETIRFDLLNYDRANPNEKGDLILNGGSILELELSDKLAKDESVLLLDGDLFVKADSKIRLTGEVDKLGGEHTLITLTEGSEIRGDGEYAIDNDMMADGWFTKVELVDNGKESNNIVVDVTYDEEVNSKTLGRDAMLGGADVTEATYIYRFGQIALENAEISKYEIAFASEDHAALATLLNNVGGDTAASAQLAGELTADRSGATIYAAQNAINQNMSRIVARSLDIRNSQSNYHADYGSSWLNVYGSTGSKDINGRFDGFDIDGMGFSFGTDGMISKNLYAGFNLSYSEQEMQGVVYQREHDLNSYQGAFYALWNHDQLFVSTIASAGFNLYTSNRMIADQDSRGDYDGYNLALRMTAGYDFEAGGVAIQPLVAAEINKLGIEAYEERGSDASLGYKEQKVHQHKLGLGVNLSKNLTFRDRQFKPSLSVMGWHDLKADDRELDTYTMIDKDVLITADIADGSDYRYELTAGADYVSDDGEMKAGFNIQHSIEEGMQDTALLFQVKYAL